MKLGYKQFLQHTVGVFGLCGRGTMLFAYWQCWSFFKVHLISNYESLLASFNPEFSFQYSFSSVVREEGIRTSYSLTGFISLALFCVHWRAEHPMPSAANLPPVAAGKCAYHRAPSRGGRKLFLFPHSPSALTVGNLKVGTIAPENTASSSCGS